VVEIERKVGRESVWEGERGGGRGDERVWERVCVQEYE
jgi:hypothetical protein